MKSIFPLHQYLGDQSLKKKKNRYRCSTILKPDEADIEK